VPGPDLEVLGERPELLERSKKLSGSLLHRAHDEDGTLQQIGTPDVSHKEKVTGQGTHRLGGRFRVGDEKGQMLRRVSRNMEGPHLDGSHSEAGAVQERSCLGVSSVLVFPVRTASVGEVEMSARTMRQLPHTGDEVGVDVGLGHVGDAEPFAVCSPEIAVQIPVGIDDQRFPTRRTADQVTCLRELGVEEAFEDHGGGNR
jgi:hypothetical protein